jgi:hypothetical protein
MNYSSMIDSVLENIRNNFASTLALSDKTKIVVSVIENQVQFIDPEDGIIVELADVNDISKIASSLETYEKEGYSHIY